MEAETKEYLAFKRELLARKYSQSSIDTYLSCFGIIQERADFGLNIDKIKDYVIANIHERSYHKQIVATVRNYYKYVLKINLDLSDLPYPRKEEKIPEVLSESEVKKIIEQPKNLKHQVIICLLYSCGLRISELIHLKFTDINRDRMEINIRAAKGAKDRIVVMSSELLGLLEDYYNEYLPKIYLINGQYGGQYTESSINQLLKYWAKKAGVKKRIHAHKLRHSFATHLHENGVELNIIKDLLGHSDVKTTEIYTKTSQAKRKIPSLLSGINL